jgi:hypothetical protein
MAVPHAHTQALVQAPTQAQSSASSASVCRLSAVSSPALPDCLSRLGVCAPVSVSALHVLRVVKDGARLWHHGADLLSLSSRIVASKLFDRFVSESEEHASVHHLQMPTSSCRNARVLVLRPWVDA